MGRRRRFDTDDLAVVVPLVGRPVSLLHLLGLGLLLVGSTRSGRDADRFHRHPHRAARVSARIGVGAIVQVIVQIVPSLRAGSGEWSDRPCRVLRYWPQARW